MTAIQITQTLYKLRTVKSGVTQKGHADKWKPAVGRLAARINDLREEGHDIATVMLPNKHNRGRHALYILIKEKPNG